MYVLCLEEAYHVVSDVTTVPIYLTSGDIIITLSLLQCKCMKSSDICNLKTIQCVMDNTVPHFTPNSRTNKPLLFSVTTLKWLS